MPCASANPCLPAVPAVLRQVVAADLNTSGSKDYVEFKIRVADGAGEWTVSRRYRNFESLHRQLRQYSQYRWVTGVGWWVVVGSSIGFTHSWFCGAWQCRFPGPSPFSLLPLPPTRRAAQSHPARLPAPSR